MVVFGENGCAGVSALGSSAGASAGEVGVREVVLVGFSVVVAGGVDPAHLGSSESRARSLRRALAFSRVPTGSPASTDARADSHRSVSFIGWQPRLSPDSLAGIVETWWVLDRQAHMY